MILNGRPPDRAAHARDFLPSRGKFTASVLVVFRHLTTDDDKSHCRRRIIELRLFVSSHQLRARYKSNLMKEQTVLMEYDVVSLVRVSETKYYTGR